eukprot:6373249-Alexandrium_andersonii.AAC.1
MDCPRSPLPCSGGLRALSTRDAPDARRDTPVCNTVSAQPFRTPSGLLSPLAFALHLQTSGL